VRLRLDLVEALRDTVPVPLALHGASSIAPADLQTAIALGVRKINVGSVLKQSYFAALAEGCAQVGPEANPYEIIGSGYPQDVLARGRLAMQQTVEQWMGLLGSAGKA
jgi:fructose-bisphosphate aldolase class II